MNYSTLPETSKVNLFASVEEMEGEVLNPKVCIICQEDQNVPVTSEKTGRARMKRAATIRNDIVTKRIKLVTGDEEQGDDSGMFVYIIPTSATNSTHILPSLKLLRKRVQELVALQCVTQTSHLLKAPDSRKPFVKMCYLAHPQASTRILEHYPALSARKSNTRNVVTNSDYVSMTVSRNSLMLLGTTKMLFLQEFQTD